jgi:hypothetical protein
LASPTLNTRATQALSSLPNFTSGAPGTIYSIKIVNSLGAVVKTATTAQQNWQTDVSNLIPGNYVLQVVNNGNKTVVGESSFIKL